MKHRRTALLGLTGLILAAALAGGLSCKPYDGSAVLTVTILTQPQGGSGIDSVWCVFSGVATDTSVAPGEKLSGSIDLMSVWHSPHGTYNEEHDIWQTNGEAWTLSTYKAAPEGYTLDKDFWVVFTWSDAGGDHELKSAVAQCR